MPAESDAKRPCSTCVRSHAHAVAHAPPGTSLPPKPECTFDDVAESTTSLSESPRNRHEKLENRIHELEILLSQKDATIRELSPRSSVISAVSHTGFTSEGVGLTASKTTNFTSEELNGMQASAQVSTLRLPLASHFQNGTTISRDSVREEAQFPQQIDFPSTHIFNSPELTPSTDLSLRLDVMWPNWPPNLPGPELLHHLVEVFFRFHPHANRLFHAASFRSTLSLPPSHTKFPSTPVLHAICAIGSLYTAVVTSPPLPDFQQYPPALWLDEIFLQRQRIKEHRADSFAEQQAKYARETADHLNSIGEDLFQVLQAPARNVIEDEMRRNAFWLAYAVERQHGCGNGWALSLDDQDISQLLPVRGDQFENSVISRYAS
ncbi:hypothetical protein C0993_005351 [Termitomyces sp. T159_Od127]|nr:hypothetical protein C0993_005351 [Termitomyces sp. T159_Od127]